MKNQGTLYTICTSFLQTVKMMADRIDTLKKELTAKATNAPKSTKPVDKQRIEVVGRILGQDIS